MKTHTQSRFAALLKALLVGIITILGSSASLLAQGTPPDVTYTEINKSQFTSLAAQPSTWWASGSDVGAPMQVGYCLNEPEAGVSDFGFWWFNSPVHISLSYNNGFLTYTKGLVGGDDYLNATLRLPLVENDARHLLIGIENTSSLAGSSLSFANVSVNLTGVPDFSVDLGQFRGIKVEFSDAMPPVFQVEADVTFRTGNGLGPDKSFRFDMIGQPGVIPEPSSFALLGLGLVAILSLSAQKRRSVN